MSLDAYQETRAHRRRVLNAIYLVAVALVIATVILAAALWLRPVQRLSISLPEDVPKPKVGWKPEHYCFRSTLTFVSGSATQCQKIGGDQQPGDECQWNFQTEESIPLEKVVSSADSPYSIAIYGGHDPEPIREGSEFDSNFDLAFQRALTISKSLGHAQSHLSLLLTASQIERICACDISTKLDAPDYARRRSPVIQVTVWTPSQ